MKIFFLFPLILLSGCSLFSYNNSIDQLSNILGSSIYEIQTKFFKLTSYQRITTKNPEFSIYIEGDGKAWLNKKRASLDPTPRNSVVLKLANLDPADNVIYLARPCQYTKTVDGSPCDQKYWTSHRFAPEVIEAMNSALDDIKQRHQITGFNLIGFSGGGNIAALLAAKRGDVMSIRTVAGNLNHELQSNIHSVSEMPQSLSAKDVAHHISYIPQMHFVGSEDQIVPRQLYDSYKKESGSSGCVQSYVVNGVEHIKGWESVWKSLLNKPVRCLEF